MDPEIATLELQPNTKDRNDKDYKMLLALAFQSFGIVYGELSIAPLYVFKSTFVDKLESFRNEDAIFGALSFIFWTLTAIPLIKYSFIVLSAEDNGEGGTFALYSILCRHIKIGPFHNKQVVDEDLSMYKVEQRSKPAKYSLLKRFLEGNIHALTGLLIIVLFGTCMVIGDGILTPAIAALSAVSGLQVAFPRFHDHHAAILASVVLVCIFALQHFGTHKVSFFFAPIIIIWLLCIACIGIYNMYHWNVNIVRAISPYYMYTFFRNAKTERFISLGGIVLCITGTEAMFADLGHFTQTSIKIAFACVVYPCLVLSYMGHAAYLSKNLDAVESSFYTSVPGVAFWPVFIVGTFASVAGSQAVISASFSVIKQCYGFGCFPRIKIVHTSNTVAGQVYIPEINWILMIICIVVTISFRDTTYIGNAYGLASVTVMLVTTFLMSLIILIIWQKNILLATLFFITFGSIELLYFCSCIFKVPEGGWVPLASAFLFMAVMYVWHYGTSKKYQFDLENKVSMKWILSLGPSLGMVRVPGIGLIYTELVSGVPPIFSHFLTNLPAFHQVLVFVCIKSVPVPHILPEERYLVGRIGPKEYHMYRCIVRYGYKDVKTEDYDFENQLVLNIAEFIQNEGEHSTSPYGSEETDDGRMIAVGNANQTGIRLLMPDMEDDGLEALSMSTSKSTSLQSIESVLDIVSSHSRKKKVRFQLPKSPDMDPSIREELSELIEAKELGVVYMLGHSYFKAKKNSSTLKKLAIDVGYSFLQRNCRAPCLALSIPHICLLEVGMIYYI